MCQAMIQNLLGCENVAELNDLKCVYGIVTNCMQWNFIRNTDDEIKMEEMFVALKCDISIQEMLADICSKIYSMLYNDDKVE